MCYITDAKDALTAFFLCAFKHILSICLRLDLHFVWILPLCRALAFISFGRVSLTLTINIEPHSNYTHFHMNGSDIAECTQTGETSCSCTCVP